MPPPPRAGRFAAAHRANPHLINQPLLRPRFHSTGPYRVSFVYLHAGMQFARRGDLRMTLPRMDVPVGLVERELFVPEQYSTRAVEGNVISTQRAFVSCRDGDLRRISGVAGGTLRRASHYRVSVQAVFRGGRWATDRLV